MLEKILCIFRGTDEARIESSRSSRAATCLFMLIAVAALSVCHVTDSFAVIANPDPVTIVQPDGTKISIVLKGDEYLHWNEDETGYPVIRSADGKWWVYAQEELGILVPTSLVAGQDDPVAEGLEKPDISRLVKEAMTRPMMQAVPDDELVKASPFGTMQNLVVLVSYSDLAVAKTRQEFDDLFNQVGYTTDGATGSVKDYYDEVSYNQLDVQSTVVEAVTIPNGYAYYGANDAWGNDLRPRTMVSDALAALESRGFDFTTVDGDGDGWVDGLTIIHAGGGEEYGGNNSNYIWSHYWGLSSTVTYDGIRMRYYHTEPARRGWDSTPSTWGITRIGVIAHETGHFIGLPDLYDYGYDSQGTGDFCLMSGGSWNGSIGSTPSHMSAWCKVDLGWVTPTTISSGGVYPVSQVETSQQIYKLQGGFSSNEFFLVENRQGTGFDSALPGSLRGLMIWHVDENQPNNDDQTHFMVDLEEASGTQHLEQNTNSGEDSDYFRQGNATEFTGITTPNNNSYSASPLGLDITSISATGAMMSFAVNGMDLTITSPLGGDIVDVGDVHQVTWTLAGGSADSFSIYLSIDSGSNYNYPVVTGLSGGATFYNWTVPNLPVPTARLKVEAWSGGSVAGVTTNSSDFAIKGKYRYVSPSGGNISPYSLPAWAANDIQDAIDVSDTGDSIMVAASTYNSAVTVDKPVFLFGGWDVSFTSRDPETNVTTINSSGSVVSFMNTNPDPTGIDGFTITGGTGTYLYLPTLGTHGGGIFAYESSPVIRGNKINSCGYIDGTSYSAGGGIACYSGTVTIEDNIIDACVAQTGGGIYIYQVDAAIRRNTINGSTADPMFTGQKDGGGIYAYQSTIDAEDNMISGNIGYMKGGGVYARFSPASFSGDTIAGNHATGTGGGIETERSSLQLAGVSIIDNISDGSAGGICHRFAELNIENSIIALNIAGSLGGGIQADSIWGSVKNNTIDRNRSAIVGGNIFMASLAGIDIRNNVVSYGYPDGFMASDGPGVTFQYNDCFGNNGQDVVSLIPDTTNFSRNPFFADTTSMDYHFAVHSGGIDTGDPVISDPDGSRADVGVYGGPLAVMAAPAFVTGLSAVAIDDITIQLAWDLQLPGGLDYYAVYGDTLGGIVPDEEIYLGSVPSAESSFDHSPVGGCWYYKVSVINSIGYGGGYSNEAGDCAAGPDLIAPTVTVVYPDGGEIFAPGDTIDIQWVATDNVQVDSVSIFFSDNGGTDFTLLAGSEPNDSLYKWVAPEIDADSCLVKIVAYDPSLLSGEDTSDSLFTITAGTTDAGDMPAQAFYLRQNYPNPFNPTTRIVFAIGQSSNVSLRIYDVAGRLVRVLLNEKRDVGRYEEVWNGLDDRSGIVSSGVYFYRLIAGDQVRTRKMVLMR
ncbi:MAG: M6 family metalloprotease domain-containing protein [Bacteroidales bacterium]|nr:M6 family metalloprotease domain-containing protein [Candidatus Latescibacterota bacterium]